MIVFRLQGVEARRGWVFHCLEAVASEGDGKKEQRGGREAERKEREEIINKQKGKDGRKGKRGREEEGEMSHPLEGRRRYLSTVILSGAFNKCAKENPVVSPPPPATPPTPFPPPPTPTATPPPAVLPVASFP